MHPQSRPLALLLAGLLAAPSLLHAQQDAPPVDVGQLLQTLRTMREQQTAQLKTIKQTALQQLTTVAGSPERSAQLWEDAVRATQFDGMAKEGAQFRAWKESEGEALKNPQVQNAAHLHLTWLVLTLQRSAGAQVKDLVPAVVNYTKELLAAESAMEIMADNMKREREAAAVAPPGAGRRNQPPNRGPSEGEVKKAYDQILKRGLAGSPVVKWMNLADAVKMDKWEENPSNFDGIFRSIVLPELRSQKDQRALEYWDIKLKKEADAASRSRLAYEVDKFNTQRRPALLWERAQEFMHLGQRNRAIGEMFNLIKTHPTHPNASDWIKELEQVIAPPPAPTPAAEAPAAPAFPPPPGAPPVPNVPGL